MKLAPADLNFVAAGLRLLALKQKAVAGDKHPSRLHTLELLKRVEAEILKVKI